MKLQDLFSELTGGRIRGEAGVLEREVSGLTADARKATANGVFVAIRGTKADGHDHLPAAVAAGVIGVVVSSYEKVPANFTGSVLIVTDGRAALDHLAARFYGNPGSAMFCAGVTGTNGKTSTTYLIEHLLTKAGRPTGVIGTVDHHLGAQVWPSEMTTPDPISLQSRLRDFCDAGAKAVAMEVSSHALHQHRADAVPFDVGVFTNLTRDHLDYHPDMDSYFAAKSRLFTELLERSDKKSRFAVIRGDDSWGKKIRVPTGVTKWTFGTSFQSDFRYQVIKMDVRSTTFKLWSPWGAHDFVLPMPGEHNVQNAVGAIAAASAAGIPIEQSLRDLPSFGGVPGRLQLVRGVVSRAVFVDYAHTPDALQNVIATLQAARAASDHEFARLWVVFGCGGDRDRGKRPEMAKVAAKADEVVVTSDNPRTEDPRAIIAEILTGIPPVERGRIKVEPDRAAAIKMALKDATPGDIILIAGKGHEDYQIIGETKHPFSDVTTAETAAREEDLP